MSLKTSQLGAPIYDYVRAHCTILELHEAVPESPSTTSLPSSPKSPPKLSLNCPRCNKSFSSKSNLNRHTKRQKCLNNACNICGKIFTKTALLEPHLKLHERETLQINCPYCEKVFSQQAHLKVHISNRVCLKSSKENLDDRMYSRLGDFLEGEEKCCQCEQCDKVFLHKKNLVAHVAAVHSGTTAKQECLVCGAEFSTKGALTRHVKQKHANVPVVRHQCTNCQKTFSSKGNLTKHQREFRCTTPSSAIQSCQNCGYHIPTPVKQLSPPKRQKLSLDQSSNAPLLEPQILNCANCGKVAILH